MGRMGHDTVAGNTNVFDSIRAKAVTTDRLLSRSFVTIVCVNSTSLDICVRLERVGYTVLLEICDGRG
jgi:hypothetical protein